MPRRARRAALSQHRVLHAALHQAVCDGWVVPAELRLAWVEDGLENDQAMLRAWLQQQHAVLVNNDFDNLLVVDGSTAASRGGRVLIRLTTSLFAQCFSTCRADGESHLDRYNATLANVTRRRRERAAAATSGAVCMS